MRIGDARVSKADGSQSLDLQRDALRASFDHGCVSLPARRLRRLLRYAVLASGENFNASPRAKMNLPT